METHSYSPSEALRSLIRRVERQDESLAEQIRLAIDAGKDVEETTQHSDRRHKQRTYRKKIRLTDEEALRVALDALRSCFVELPLFVRSAEENFKLAAIGRPRDRPSRQLSVLEGLVRDPEILTDQNFGRHLEVELQTETRISSANQQTFHLEPSPEERVREQQANFDQLAQFLSFEEE